MRRVAVPSPMSENAGMSEEEGVMETSESAGETGDGFQGRLMAKQEAKNS